MEDRAPDQIAVSGVSYSIGDDDGKGISTSTCDAGNEKCIGRTLILYWDAPFDNGDSISQYRIQVDTGDAQCDSLIDNPDYAPTYCNNAIGNKDTYDAMKRATCSNSWYSTNCAASCYGSTIWDRCGGDVGMCAPVLH